MTQARSGNSHLLVGFRLRVLAVVLFSLCQPLIPASVPGKHRITHEDIWLMKRVGAPVPSPDGKWVAFSVTEPAYDEKDQVSDLWICATDGSTKPRRITHTAGGESGLAWSPDSRKVAFAADRVGDEVDRPYVIDLASRGAALKVT